LSKERNDNQICNGFRMLISEAVSWHEYRWVDGA